MINEYINAVPSVRVDWLTISNAYIKIEQFDNALQAVSHYNSNPEVTEGLKYQVLISEIYCLTVFFSLFIAVFLSVLSRCFNANCP